METWRDEYNKELGETNADRIGQVYHSGRYGKVGQSMVKR